MGTRTTVGMTMILVAAMVIATSVPPVVVGVSAPPAAPVSNVPAGNAVLTWTRLPGVVEAFAGSRVAQIERGADGYLAVGRSIATGVPRLWRSAEGLAWERVAVPPTTFGGAEPSDLAWGPNGWVALGWDVALRRVTQQVWLSDDGLTWRPSSDPSGRLRSKAPEYPGPADVFRLPRRALDVIDGRMVISEDGSVPYRTSADGEVWRPTDDKPWPETSITAPPGMDLDIDGYLVDGPRGHLFVAWPSIWASRDGQTWIQAQDPSDYPLDFIGWEGGWIAHDAEGLGNGIWYSADGSSWTPGTITDPDLAEETHLRSVQLDDSRLLAFEGLGYPGVLTGAWIGTFGSPDGTPRVTMAGTGSVDPVTDPNLVPLVRPPGLHCPDKPRSLRGLFRIAPWKMAVCFDDDPQRVVGPAFRTTEAPGESGTAFDNAIFVEGSAWGIAPVMQAHPVDYRNGVRDYRVVGHFVDPSCRLVPDGYPTPAASLLRCQLTFVPTSIRRAGR